MNTNNLYMKKILLITALSVATLTAFGASGNNPVANPKAQVVEGKARFTVLTDRLIRLEWAADGQFEDHASLAIINRDLPVPSFSVSRSGMSLTIKTKSLTLVYKGGEGPLSAQNLAVSFKLNGKTVKWNPGMEDKGNLMGTARTLDGCQGPERINNNDPLEKGILSRDGWVVVDESQRHLFVPDDSDWGEWVAARPEGERQDLYLFAYGHDYKAALADYAKVAGSIPMPPKFVFGYWWSRYWAYTDREFLALGQEFRDRKLPIDVMVIDMDWHHTWPHATREEHDKGIGWTGYSWNRDLIAQPEAFLSQVHALGLKTSLNLHPAGGISPRENQYPAFLADYLSRTSDYDGPRGYVQRDGNYTDVPFRIDQRAWTDAYFNSVLHPLEKEGVDFWWLDWQQWKESKYVPGLSNTFWLNHTFFNDKVRRNGGLAPEKAERPLIYHRWGGLGSHRYQLGFSGDTFIKWEVLGYLPEFTAMASNVLYGYWGHDLGGHMQRGDNPTDPQLFTRWLQYGVFSPIFKTHSTSSAVLERRIWMFPEHYQYMKDALELRYALTPYIYDMARQAFQTGISLCRPLYYEYPETEAAYQWKQEYFFGDNILAATICEPLGADGMAGREVWLPGGTDWYDMAHHTTLKGGTVQKLRYGIDQNAWFVKAGAIIPMAAEGIQNLQSVSNQLRIFIAPGKGRSTYTHFEDDGVSQAYDTQYTATRIEKNATGSGVTVEIGPSEGFFQGMPATRKLSLILGGASRCPKASLNGRALECQYNEKTHEACVFLPETPANQALKVLVRW